MQFDSPAISVVLPTHNRANQLDGALDSVFQQTRTDFELIVVDDGSTDETRQQLSTIADPRLRVLTSERNRGANWARNRGVEASRASLVAFLDSDDRYLPGKLETLISLFQSHPGVDLWVDSFVSCKTKHGRPVRRAKLNPAACIGPEFRAGLFERRVHKATTALAFRRQALIDAGLFDETLRRRQDFDVVLRFTRTHVGAATDHILWEKHESADAISNDARTYLDASIAVCRRHPEYLAEYPEALYRDLRSHFSSLLKKRQWQTLAADLRRYQAEPTLEKSLWRLLLGIPVCRPEFSLRPTRSSAV